MEQKQGSSKSSDQSVSQDPETNATVIKLKKEVGLFEAIAIICGIIIGSGIFLSPKGVLQNAGSVSLTLITWVASGAFAMIGAICFAELGTTITVSGGEYAYIRESFGRLPGFLVLWVACGVFLPTSTAIMALTFSKYTIQPFFPSGSDIPDTAVRLVAGVTIIFLTWLNSYNVRLTTRIQNVFLFAKIGGVLIITVAGIFYLANGNFQNFRNPWEGSQTDPGSIALGFYSGFYSFSGWNYLNYITEELRNPYKNLPRAIYISLPLVTIIYTLANVGYLAVLSKEEMLSSDAIGVIFGNKMLGKFSWIIPVFVALSSFGGLSIHIMACSRLIFVGARNGDFLEAISLISINNYTPTPALVFLCCLSLIYLCTTDVFLLIDYTTFVESCVIFASVCGLLWIRYTRRDIPRPIKFPVFVPVAFICFCALFIILPIYVRPFQVAVGCFITLTGIPFYFLFLWWENSPKIIGNMSKYITTFVQKLFLSSYEDKEG